MDNEKLIVEEIEVKDSSQKKYKSPVMWSALVAQVLALLVVFGLVDIVESEKIQMAIGLILEILATIGILNNPNSKDSF